MIVSEERLTQSILEYDDVLMASLPNPSECVHVFSESFERKMRKLIRKADHYVAYKVLRYAASVLITFLLSASLFLTFNSEARAAVVDWIKEYAHGVYNYFFTAEETEISADYALGWVPDGYELVNSFEHLTGKSFNYHNQDGKKLYFAYSKGTKDISFTAGDGTYIEKHIFEDGFQVDIYLSQTENKANGITWISEDENILFTVSAYENEDVLVQIAKCVILE